MVQRILCFGLILVVTLLAGCSPVSGLKAYVDSLDGYQFLYPTGWVQVQVRNADVVFHDIIQTTENISVVVNPVSSGKNLADIGTPEVVGERLLKNVITAAGSERSSALISATAKESRDKLYYILEYAVTLPSESGVTQQRHNLSSIAVSRGKLYTLSVSAPEERWTKVEDQFQSVVNSFSVY